YARRDWPALELAGMVWDLCSDGESTTLDPALRDQIVGHYVDAGGPGEPGALVPLMRLESLVSALFSLTRAARGQPWDREFTQMLIATLDELAYCAGWRLPPTAGWVVTPKNLHTRS